MALTNPYNFKVTFTRAHPKLNYLSIINGRIATASFDKTVKLFDLGGKVTTLNDHKGSVTSVVGLPDGRIISGAKDKTIKVWDVNDQCIATINNKTAQGQPFDVADLCLYAPESLAVCHGNSAINLYDVNSLQLVTTMHLKNVHVNILNATPGGLLLSAINRKLGVWDKDQMIVSCEGHTGDITAIKLLADGRVVTSSDDKTIRVWDINSGTCTNTVTYNSPIHSLGLLPDGRAVTGSKDKEVKFWDIDSGKCIGQLSGITKIIEHIAVFPDGRFITGSSADGNIQVWEDANNTFAHIATKTSNPTPVVHPPTQHTSAPAGNPVQHHPPTQHTSAPAGNPVQHHPPTQHHASPGHIDTSSSLGALSAKIASLKMEEKEEAKKRLKEEFAKGRLRPKKDYGGIDKKPRGISYLDLEFVLTNAELPIFKESQKSGGGIYTYLDPFFKDSKLDEVFDCIMNAKSPSFTVKKDVKSRSGIAEKLFLRNKPLNDVVRCMVICSDEANGPDDFMQILGKLKEDSKNYFSYWVEDDTGKSGWGTYKVFAYYTQLPGKVFPIEVQFVSKIVYELEKDAQTHLDYESLRQNFGALAVYKSRGLDYITLFKEIPDLNGVWEKYITNE